MRALIFDLDGTLLDRSRRVSQANQAALLRAQAAGFRLIIATSRPIRSIRRFVPEVVLSHALTISLNGAAVFEPGARDARLIAPITHALDPLLEAMTTTGEPIRFSVETDGHRFASSETLDAEALWTYHNATPDMVMPLEALNAERATKVAADGIGRPIPKTLSLARQFGTLRFIPADDHTFVNIVSSRVDKSLTLTDIARRDDIDLTRSIAFGDDLPDLGLFRHVGRSVAMANAKDEVKALATEEIGDCDTDAIADFIHALLA
jgi:Cof subfamily protein (haloacid dehalogenase superfamily)